VLDGCDAAGIVVEGGRVRGLRVTARGADAAPADLAAELVADAGGRGSRMPRWLEEVGYLAPEETEVQVDVGYASRFYRRPPNHAADWTGLMIYPPPGGTRLGVLFPVEDDRWMVTLVGWFGDHPTADDAGFLDFARSLDASDLHAAIRDAEPCSPVAIHRFPSDRRRHYERLRRLPEGVAVLGDAFCSFNPIYGQGMTTGALAAQTLDRMLASQRRLRADLDGFAGRFHHALSHVIDSPWLMTTTEDLRSPRAVGRRPRWMPLVHWYTERIHRLTWRDRTVGLRFLEVMHLTASPRALLHPWVMLRALTAGRA
jgi:2-polyprenyl-6-methoxyphenol hydroxylase-like FAD-dependent oxidoreductase